MYLDQAVIKLHEIARLVEQQIGVGRLSEDVRNCADRLSDIFKKEVVDYDPVI